MTWVRWGLREKGTDAADNMKELATLPLWKRSKGRVDPSRGRQQILRKKKRERRIAIISLQTQDHWKGGTLVK